MESIPAEEIISADESFTVKKILKPFERKVVSSKGKSTESVSEDKRGKYRSSRISSGKSNDIAVDATIRAAAPHQLSRGRSGNSLLIHKSDFREKVREKKSGALIVFIVDSSGSMGASRRMSGAKGAVLSILNDAYQKRDRVSMVAFKGNDAIVLLQPTGSIELARKNLDQLPTGGRTPFSSGLAAGLAIIKKEKIKNNKIKPVMVIISDGRGNVSIRNGNPFEEAKEICAEARKMGILSIVIDTESGLVRLGKLTELADILGGKYYAMDDIRPDIIHDIVSNSIKIQG